MRKEEEGGRGGGGTRPGGGGGEGRGTQHAARTHPYDAKGAGSCHNFESENGARNML